MSEIDYTIGHYVSTVPDAVLYLRRLSQHIDTFLAALEQMPTHPLLRIGTKEQKIAHNRILSVSRTLIRISGTSNNVLAHLLEFAKGDIDDSQLRTSVESIGKGVYDAKMAINLMEGEVGRAGYTLILEDFLAGPRAFYIPMEDTFGVNSDLFMKRTRDTLINPSFFVDIRSYDKPEPRLPIEYYIAEDEAIQAARQLISKSPRKKRKLQKTIALLGFAFKADTGDTRESPTITLVRDFLVEHTFINIYDPKVEEAQIWLDLTEACPGIPLEIIQMLVIIAPSALEACKNTEVIVIATKWQEFCDMDWKMVYAHMAKPAFVFDGCMMVDTDALQGIGFKVKVIGHGDSEQM